MTSPRSKPRTRRKKRVHSVSTYLSVAELTKAGTALTLEVRGVGGKLGELEIGRGALYWTGRDRRKSKRLSWARFAEMMDELAYGGRPRRAEGSG